MFWKCLTDSVPPGTTRTGTPQVDQNPFSNNQKYKMTGSKNNFDIQEEHGDRTQFEFYIGRSHVDSV
eukprot:1610113-Prorocentrum_lima.AAC.1